MKVPPKRKGNARRLKNLVEHGTLNESPSEKEGKLERPHIAASWEGTLNESPSEKEGKFDPRDTPQLGGFSPQ